MEYSDILVNIRKVLRSINLESKRIEKEYGISIPQYLCLSYLNNQHDFKATASQLKEHLTLNASTITGIISRLEKKGFIAKLPSDTDKRSVYIYLTALGAKTIESVPSLLHEKLSKKLQNTPDRDLEKLQEAMQLLVKFMEVEAIDASPLLTSEGDLNH